MITVEDWAEIRRLHRAEGLPIKEIARQLGLARNTVRAALRSDRPPTYQRPSRGSVVDPYEPAIRALLATWPRMPGPVIAQRIDWPYSEGPLKKRLAKIRPEYVGVDPVSRTSYRPGELAQCDLWFPATKIPVGAGQARILPVLVMALGYSRFLSATVLPSRQTGDLLSGMWQLITGLGRVPRTLVWDREAGIAIKGRVNAPVAGFVGTLATRIQLAPPRDPEFKGIVERANGYLETSFLPGRSFTSPEDFTAQLDGWLVRANQRTVRSIAGRPAELLAADHAAMTVLPPVDPGTGLRHRTRLARDHYVRVDTCDYSVDPRVIGRFVDTYASLSTVTVVCDEEIVARHSRSWAQRVVVNDPAHLATAQALRREFAARREAGARAARQHADGHTVVLRALPDYDALFGVDFDPTPDLDPNPDTAEATPS
ncbi:IS21 family transposase [Pseudonocardia sp. HH130630-07]|uniref:IS21 family transposase n=1 Tax=Pseudonocardia sp. HH130630-07 TaxID=1690815 RepID=UPI000814F62C|nr:IS21 family transposase [Pseudonocardia sp. HH130630-07]ANY05802.1 transposase [Pseudonocardia sp. HH130630-07]